LHLFQFSNHLHGYPSKQRLSNPDFLPKASYSKTPLWKFMLEHPSSCNWQFFQTRKKNQLRKISLEGIVEKDLN